MSEEGIRWLQSTAGLFFDGCTEESFERLVSGSNTASIAFDGLQNYDAIRAFFSSSQAGDVLYVFCLTGYDEMEVRKTIKVKKLQPAPVEEDATEEPDADTAADSKIESEAKEDETAEPASPPSPRMIEVEVDEEVVETVTTAVDEVHASFAALPASLKSTAIFFVKSTAEPIPPSREACQDVIEFGELDAEDLLGSLHTHISQVYQPLLDNQLSANAPTSASIADNQSDDYRSVVSGMQHSHPHSVAGSGAMSSAMSVRGGGGASVSGRQGWGGQSVMGKPGFASGSVAGSSTFAPGQQNTAAPPAPLPSLPPPAESEESLKQVTDAVKGEFRSSLMRSVMQFVSLPPPHIPQLQDSNRSCDAAGIRRDQANCTRH